MPSTPLIRVAALDRQPAYRLGLEVYLAAQPGLAWVGAAAGTEELWPLLQRAAPDVVLLDHQPSWSDRLALCLRLTGRPRGPRVILCAAEAGDDLVAPATLAGASAIVDKGSDPRHLLDAIRAVARGDQMMPPLTPRLRSAAAARLDPADGAEFARRLAGAAAADIATTAGILAALGSPRRPEQGSLTLAA